MATNTLAQQVAEELVMPLIDWDYITRGLVPGAYLFDDIHPTGDSLLKYITFTYIYIQLGLISLILIKCTGGM